MGQSTNAYLAFGIDLGDNDEIEWPAALQGDDGGEYPDLDSYIAEKAGLKKPPHADYAKPEWGAYFTAKREAVEAFPFDLMQHCSGNYPMWVLGFRDTRQSAYRGDTTVVTMREIKPEEIAALKAFCGELGLPWSEPDWRIFSLWM